MIKIHRFIKKEIVLDRTVNLFIFSVLLVGLLSACGISGKVKALTVYTKSVFGAKLNVKVTISENANQNNPIALDLVIVYDERLLDQLIGMSSKDWFVKREQIKRDYLDGTGLEYWSWEWVPGQGVPIQELPLKSMAKGGLVFADYYSPGTHRFRIDQFKDIKIQLEENHFSVEPL